MSYSLYCAYFVILYEPILLTGSHTNPVKLSLYSFSLTVPANLYEEIKILRDSIDCMFSAKKNIAYPNVCASI
jgi:hypothetical protein